MIDTTINQLTLDKLNSEIEELEYLLDNSNSEEKIHQFLASHSYFFNGIIRLYGCSPLYSKPRLANNYEIDFACFDSGTYGPEWYLIEIENPKHKMFVGNGDFTRETTHAIGQARDWLAWIHRNLDFAKKTFPHIEYPLGYVFIGRRKELTKKKADRLRRFNYENRKSIELHTLDWFLSAAKSVRLLVEKSDTGIGNWYLPKHALKDKDLKDGLPEKAQSFMTDFFTIDSHLIEYPDEFMRDREMKRFDGYIE